MSQGVSVDDSMIFFTRNHSSKAVGLGEDLYSSYMMCKSSLRVCSTGIHIPEAVGHGEVLVMVMLGFCYQ